MVKGRSRRAAAATHGTPVASNVISLCQRILPAHRALLAQWLAAGMPMGVCDASVCAPRPGTAPHGAARSDYVLVWVRENADPAYMISPERMEWVVTDTLHTRTLGRHRTFGDALNSIRPVLPRPEAACA